MSGQVISLVLVLAAALSGCAEAPPSIGPQTEEAAFDATAAVSSAVASTASSPPRTLMPATTPSPGRSVAALTSGSVAITVASDVRMRSKPEVGSTSEPYSPTLPKGAELFVVGGPVRESGYDWYEVLPLNSGLPTRGWVCLLYTSDAADDLVGCSSGWWAGG